MKSAFAGKSVWIGTGLAVVLALVALTICALAVGAGIWVSRRTLAQVSPAITPSVPPPPTAITPGAAPPPESGVQSRSSAPARIQLPADVPLPEKVDPQSFVGGAGQVSFLSGLSYIEAREFYQTNLEDLGWSMIPYGTRIGKSSAELRYGKAERILIVRIVELPFVGLLIEINLQA